MPGYPVHCRKISRIALTAALLLVSWCLLPGSAGAATVVPSNPAARYEPEVLDANALEALAAPVALYPDELLAIVLPASTYPLQIVQAARFLEARKSDPSLEPDPDWVDPVVALLNYPEVLALLDSDLDWTERLGHAVAGQEGELLAAIGRFRDRAYAAGNLRSDSHQRVSKNAEVIEVTAASQDSIYVPYYDPLAVIVPQSQPVYYYYPNPYPLYYYPYPRSHHFFAGTFWGLTTAYTIGWPAHRLHFYHHDHRSHPYRNRRYEAPGYRRFERRYGGYHAATPGAGRHPVYRGGQWRLESDRDRRGYASGSYRGRHWPGRYPRDTRAADRIRSQVYGRDPSGHRHGTGPDAPRQHAGIARANNGAVGNGSAGNVLNRPQTSVANALADRRLRDRRDPQAGHRRTADPRHAVARTPSGAITTPRTTPDHAAQSGTSTRAVPGGRAPAFAASDRGGRRDSPAGRRDGSRARSGSAFLGNGGGRARR